VILGVVDILADFKMAFPAPCELMIVGMRQARHLFLRNQMMRNTAEAICYAVIEMSPHSLTRDQRKPLLPELQFVQGMFVNFVPFRIFVFEIQPLAIYRIRTW
jgi:hypothetical protein